MNHDELRLECLKLAQARLSGHSTEHIVDQARAYADFVLARRDGPILRAAHEVAKEVNQ